jgi:pimeloyl-ACP methyl ester carboxylesterase
MVERVQSSDGTAIAYERSGSGSPVIVVGGAFNDRATAAPLATELAGRFTVYTYDRRGRGDSGDTAPYAVVREVADLDALIRVAGGSAALYGVSSGAVLALEAAAYGQPVSRLALFEPPIPMDAEGTHRPAAISAQLAELTSAGRNGDAVELFMTRAVGLPAEAVAGMRQAPMWPGLEKMAPTLVYDTTITEGVSWPDQRLAAVPVPALVVDSDASPDWLRTSARTLAGALVNGRYRTLEGQFHEVPPAVLAPALTEFFTSE